MPSPRLSTRAYAVRLGSVGRAPRTLFARTLRCASSGPNSFIESAAAAVSPARKLTRSARALLRRRGSFAITVTATVTDRDQRTRTVRRRARLTAS